MASSPPSPRLSERHMGDREYHEKAQLSSLVRQMYDKMKLREEDDDSVLLSKKLSYVLRYGANEFRCIEMDRDGFVRVKDLLDTSPCCEIFEGISLEVLMRFIRQDSTRYELEQSGAGLDLVRACAKRLPGGARSNKMGASAAKQYSGAAKQSAGKQSGKSNKMNPQSGKSNKMSPSSLQHLGDGENPWGNWAGALPAQGNGLPKAGDSAGSSQPQIFKYVTDLPNEGGQASDSNRQAGEDRHLVPGNNQQTKQANRMSQKTSQGDGPILQERQESDHLAGPGYDTRSATVQGMLATGAATRTGALLINQQRSGVAPREVAHGWLPQQAGNAEDNGRGSSTDSPQAIAVVRNRLKSEGINIFAGMNGMNGMKVKGPQNGPPGELRSSPLHTPTLMPSAPPGALSSDELVQRMLNANTEDNPPPNFWPSSNRTPLNTAHTGRPFVPGRVHAQGVQEFVPAMNGQPRMPAPAHSPVLATQAAMGSGAASAQELWGTPMQGAQARYDNTFVYDGHPDTGSHQPERRTSVTSNDSGGYGKLRNKRIGAEESQQALGPPGYFAGASAGVAESGQSMLAVHRGAPHSQQPATESMLVERQGAKKKLNNKSLATPAPAPAPAAPVVPDRTSDLLASLLSIHASTAASATEKEPSNISNNGVDSGRNSTGKPTPGPTAAEAPKADLKEAARNILMEADQAAKESARAIFMQADRTFKKQTAVDLDHAAEIAEEQQATPRAKEAPDGNSNNASCASQVLGRLLGTPQSSKKVDSSFSSPDTGGNAQTKASEAAAAAAASSSAADGGNGEVRPGQSGAGDDKMVPKRSCESSNTTEGNGSDSAAAGAVRSGDTLNRVTEGESGDGPVSKPAGNSDASDVLRRLMSR